MIIILGLIILIAAVITGAAGVLSNTGSGPGAWRAYRRGQHARQRLRQSRPETATVTRDRGNLPGQRDATRPDTAITQPDG